MLILQCRRMFEVCFSKDTQVQMARAVARQERINRGPSKLRSSLVALLEPSHTRCEHTNRYREVGLIVALHAAGEFSLFREYTAP